MASQTFEEMRVEADKRSLIRKIQKAIAYIAPMTVELPESLFAVGGGLVDLKTLGYLPVGLVTPDGYKFGREVESADIDALGYASAVRSDTTKVARTIGFTPLEKGRKHMLELSYGTNLTSTTQNPTTGEIVFDEPDLPVDQEYRLLVLGADGPADNQWILGRGYGSVKLSSTGEEAWGSEGAVSSELSFKVSTDEEIGSPVKHYMGGTGAVKSKLALGFTAGTP
jgi:hypothetical protein